MFGAKTTTVFPACRDHRGNKMKKLFGAVASFLVISLTSVVPSVFGADGEAHILTDKNDYPLGSTVQLSGIGFLPEEKVKLQILHADGTPNDDKDHKPWTVVADTEGKFHAA